MIFNSPYGIVTLTDERRAHILHFHPDVSRHVAHFAETLARPDVVISSAHDSEVMICYRILPRPKKYLAIVVRIGMHPFILTAYLAKKPKRDTL